ncbi:MAG TPA: uridine kinase [Gammaproteobacteria bacterium]|jgi:molybdenum storage protein|nr:uridine kinase [Gammaproteobacteria bacterium]
MSELLKKETLAGRTHLKSRFMRESLVDRDVIEGAITDEIAILPYLNVISLGGKSIIDRGRKAVYPVIEELVEIRKHYKFVLAVTGGVRVDHTLAMGLDFGLPVGGLAMTIGAIEEQNANMMYSLMANHGAVRVPKDHYTDLPHYLDNDMIPILTSNPPHHYWEKPPSRGVLPENGSDFGMYMTAEGLGGRSMIFVKDQNGLYDKDPEKHSDAKFIPKISAQELLANDQEDLIIDRTVIEMLARARHLKKIYIVNGLVPGTITKAINGEDVGTIIYKD